MRVITAAQLAEMCAAAARSPRLRTHFNLHDDLGDPVQRVVIALQPGTYIRPHRHGPGIWELFALMSGSCAVLTFDSSDVVTERVVLRTGETMLAQVPDGAWHAIVCLEPNTVALESKPGPYRPTTDKDFAAWAPSEGDAGADSMVRWYETAGPGDRRA